MSVGLFSRIKSLFFPSLAGLIISCALFLLFTVEIAYGLTVDRVLATVGDEIITFAEYKQFSRGSDGVNNDAVDQSLLRRLIEEKIIIREAKRKGFDVTDGEVEKMIEDFKYQNSLSQEDLENFLKEEGLNIKSYREILRGRALLSRLVGSEVDSKVIVRDEEAEDYYRKNRKEFISSPEQIEVKAIFLKLREDASVTEITDLKLRALRITTFVEDGYNFDSLVDEYSDEPLRSQGGILGKFARGALIPPLDAKAFLVKEGGISDPIWVNDGVYILQITGKSGEVYKTFGEVKEEIKNALYRQKREGTYNEWIKALWERSSVVINQSY